jgi:hypothetical protein
LHNEHGSDIAEIYYFPGSYEDGIRSRWSIIIDNFPAPRKHYSTDFPIRDIKEFIVEMKRIGLEFEII